MFRDISLASAGHFAGRDTAHVAVEYNTRWGDQLARWEQERASETDLLAAVRRSSYGTAELVALMDFLPVTIPAPDFFEWRMHKIGCIVREYHRGHSLVELGCGGGKNLLLLHHLGICRLAGTELTEQGVSFARARLAHYGCDAKIEKADLFDDTTATIATPGCTIFTNYFLEQLPGRELASLRAIAALQPEVVIHVEPWHSPSGNRGWIELGASNFHARAKNYATRIGQTLLGLAKAGAIDLEEVRPLGFSPHLTHSPTLFVWRPRS